MSVSLEGRGRAFKILHKGIEVSRTETPWSGEQHQRFLSRLPCLSFVHVVGFPNTEVPALTPPTLFAHKF